MRNATFRAWPSAAAALVLVLILAACGGGAAATQRPAAATSNPASPTVAGTPTSAPVVDPTDAPANVPTTAPPPAAGSLEACSLLTVDEVGTATGGTFDTALPTSDEMYTYCAYSGLSSLKTSVTKSPDTASMVFNTMKINAGEAVSGVGDEAFYSTDGFRPGLYFLKSGQMAFIGGGQGGPSDEIVALGVLMASRM